jgi:hypothetical protein
MTLVTTWSYLPREEEKRPELHASLGALDFGEVTNETSPNLIEVDIKT